MSNNYERFPHHFYLPEEIKVNRRNYTKYLVSFDDLYEIYNFLKSNPEINKEVFHELSSITGEYKFAGIPYEDAVEDLINFDEDGYADFLDLVSELANIKAGYKHEYELRKTLAGGHLNIPDYARGTPLCYESYERIKRPKFIHIHAALSYPWYTNKNQVLNRAIILVSVINALERNGYNINLDTFELSDKDDELVNIVVNVKRHGARTNLQTLYKTSCHVEFLRRILFRVLETIDVKNDWESGYGHTCEYDMTKNVLGIGPEDIYFGTPDELDINGKDLAEDFVACLENLKLEHKFDVREISNEFKEKAKRLIK